MDFILILVIVGAILYYTKVYNSPNAKAVRAVCQGKTAEQQEVIKYFCQEGCLTGKTISDDEYLSKVRAKRDSLNLRQKALNKIGLDEDEVSEIPPAMFEGFIYKNAYAKKNSSMRCKIQSTVFRKISFLSQQKPSKPSLTPTKNHLKRQCN